MRYKLLEMPKPVKNPAGSRHPGHLSSNSGVTYNGRYWWRRTQVAKGEVCKTSIHRFESGRRLVTPPHPGPRAVARNSAAAQNTPPFPSSG